MDTTHDETKPLTNRHSATQRLLVILLCSLLVVGGMAGVVLAQTALFDDFEDQNADGWVLGGASGVVEDGVVGDYSLEHGGTNDNENRWEAVGTLNTTDTPTFYWVVKIPTDSNSNAANLVLSTDSSDPISGGPHLELVADTNDGVWEIHERTNGQIYSDVASLQSGWTAVKLEMDGSKYRFKQWDPTKSEPDTWDAVRNQTQSLTDAHVWLDGNEDHLTDEISLNTDPPDDSLSGQVTDQAGDGIEGATVETNTSVSTTTNDTGHYTADLVDGAYNLTAYKDGYVNDTATVTINNPDPTTQDFTLVEDTRALQIDTRLFIEHGETVPYTIIHGKADGTRENVTASATVTSDNTSVVTVDTSTFELNATDDVTVNNRTFVTANYTRDDGQELVARQNVTVANKTVENLDILPPVTRFGASISDRTVQVIILATAVGVAAAIFAGVFAGVAGLTMAMLMGWVIGFVGDGMIIITLITAMFIGMNVAGNVDYTVRR